MSTQTKELDAQKAKIAAANQDLAQHQKDQAELQRKLDEEKASKEKALTDSADVQEMIKNLKHQALAFAL